MKSYSKERNLKIIHCCNISTVYFSESAYMHVGQTYFVTQKKCIHTYTHTHTHTHTHIHNAVSQFVEALSYKSEGRGFNSR